jgi:DHA3 family macrolide efflux protein-like MFS transporter
MVAILPSVFLGPFVGALVDRWNRRLVMIVADAVVALAALWVVYLFWSGTMQVWHIYVLMFVRAIGGGFHWPAMMASTSLLVPEKHLARVSGANQTVNGAVSIIAPPLGALLLGLMPLYGVMAIDVGTALLAILPLLFVTIPQPQRATAAARLSPSTLWAEALEGIRFMWNWPGALAFLLIATVINFLLNPAFALLPILVTKHFGGTAWHLGGMESAWGVGVILGGLILSVWGGFRRRVLTTLTGLVALGVGTLAIGLAPAQWFWLAVGAMFFTGVTNPIVNGPVMALMQSLVPPEMQGRVFTVIQSVAAAMSPLGLAIAGPVADRFGVQAWFLLGGAVCVLLGVGAFFVPAIVHLEDGREAAGAAAGAGLE